MHQNRRFRRRGFTLIEAVAAIVILGIAVPPCLWAIRQAQIHRVSAMLPSKARWLAIEKLEDIIADRHSTTRGFTYLTGANYPNESSIAGSPGFTRSVSFTQTKADLTTAGTGYMKTTVTVGWTDTTGTARSLAISTVITDYTP